MLDWPEIIQKHGPIVRQTAYRLLSHEADVADCFQETFVAAWKASGSAPIENWPGFLKSVATAVALKRLRDRYREPRSGLADDLGAISRPAASTADVELAELAESLRQALAELEPRQAEVFCLVCLEGESYADVAAQLGITENNLGVVLNRVRCRLRERLKGFRPIRV